MYYILAFNMAKIKVAPPILLILVHLAATQQFRYPDVRRNESVVDDYYGRRVTDPYRHLEDNDSEEVKQFVEAQNNLTLQYLGRCWVKDEVAKRLAEVYNYPKYSVPTRHGGLYFSTMNSGLQNQDVLYAQDSLDSQPRVVFDPNELSQNGTIALTQHRISEDGRLAAFVLSSKGSDLATIRFLNISSGQLFPEIIEDIKFATLYWSKDNIGIFYNRFPDRQDKTADVTQSIYYHRVGSDAREDTLVVEINDSEISLMSFQITGDGDHLVISTTRGIEENKIYYANLEKQLKSGGIRERLELVPIIREWGHAYLLIGLEEGVLYFTTNNGAPNSRIIAIPLNNTDPGNWTTVVPEHAKNILTWAVQVDSDKLILNYLVDVRVQLEIRSFGNGSLLQTIYTPLGSSLSESDISANKSESEFFFKIVSSLSPGMIYRVDLTRTPYSVELLKESKVPGFNPVDFTVTQVFYESYDGTMIPMYITHKKNLTMNGGNNVLLYAYGGFGVNLLPSFSPHRLVLFKNFDGIFAVPNIRGGAEYGQKWHDAGKLLNKQNVFDDFQAAAEYLIKANYTSASKTVIIGGSNGGLLVGACANQRPDLYAAVINQVGVHDLLRFQKFTVGYAWCPEYGCSDWGNQTIFENLHRLSPLHNVRLPTNPQVQYPAILITTADHYDRVIPLHSYKLAAELQYKIGQSTRQTNPILIKIHTDAGHGQGKPISMQIEEFVEIYSFLVESAGFVFRP